LNRRRRKVIGFFLQFSRKRNFTIKKEKFPKKKKIYKSQLLPQSILSGGWNKAAQKILTMKINWS
jgi:hypothetical protein